MLELVQTLPAGLPWVCRPERALRCREGAWGQEWEVRLLRDRAGFTVPQGEDATSPRSPFPNSTKGKRCQPSNWSKSKALIERGC